MNNFVNDLTVKGSSMRLHLFRRTVQITTAIFVCAGLSGCFYSHTVEKPAPATVVTTPDSSTTTTTTTSGPDGTVERRSTTTYPSP